ncbi:MAG: bifunctional 3,4-dihydroxy-2-butanone 4-phosphate synthase/GTP cyclohydrolase II [Helicobacteraceae bacterium]|jgi:3,4-dihydroxy 2-butanone 4-phosphate synthase/GTP cyclohydrolase II|nr:bifunctional 3,4-dihydroxy-2-butanone 4-phosphate synthase/GTP cyclohydrolase II [Helicobacteraceae bacterium]
MNQQAIERVIKAIDTIKAGKMVILIDDEDRENEGDLMYAGALSTPELMNFMIKEARGLVCAALDRTIAERLELEPMVKKNTSAHETAFTVSVDAKSASTGISAYERHDTIALLSSALSKSDDFVRPGHIFPLIAKDGGVLVRTGQTEGAVDLCRLAGLTPCGVICEILTSDGTMARRPELDKFSGEKNIPIVYIADLIEYRLERESLVSRRQIETSELFGVAVTISEWLDHLGRVHNAIVFGEIGEESAVKFHIVGSDAKLLLDDRRFCGLLQAIEYLKKNGGVLLLIEEGAQSSKKEFGIGAQILTRLGIKKLTVLATKEIGEFTALSGFGLELKETLLL